MKRGQKEGPNFDNLLTHCHTKDNVEIGVRYTCYTTIINNKAYKKHTDPGIGRQVRNVGWRDNLRRQIEGAIAYVLNHYNWSLIQPSNNHKDHINRQIQNCLNENFQNERVPLSAKGLAIHDIRLLRIAEKYKLY